MMDRVTPIVLTIVSGVVEVVVTLFDRLGAVPYLIAVGIFVAFMRFIVLPLLDHGSTVTGLGLEIQNRDGHVDRSFISPAQAALPYHGIPRAGDPRS